MMMRMTIVMMMMMMTAFVRQDNFNFLNFIRKFGGKCIGLENPTFLAQSEIFIPKCILNQFQQFSFSILHIFAPVEKIAARPSLVYYT